MRFVAATAQILALAACSGLPDDPLIRAARAGRTAQITALVKGGADPNRPGGGNEWTPLMHAIHKNQRGSVIALLDAGANPNAPGGRGATPLMMAAGYGQSDIVRTLLVRGADPAHRNRIGQNCSHGSAGRVGGPLETRLTLADVNSLPVFGTKRGRILSVAPSTSSFRMRTLRESCSVFGT